jgi:hypothetical protein
MTSTQAQILALAALATSSNGVPHASELASLVTPQAALNTTRLIPKVEQGGKVAIIEDFESDYKNWTLTGKSFQSGQPYLGSRSAQIKGFEGKSFAFSYEGNNANTGKAVSKEFVIDWDQISFDIMGGTTNSTRLELVVVNDSGTEQAVRTATGDGTLNFTRKNWNVKSYKGKTAKLVITDDSAAASYGFIGVDNIRGEGESSPAVAGRKIPGIDWNNLPALPIPKIMDYKLTAYFTAGSANFDKSGISTLPFKLNYSQVTYLESLVFRAIVAPGLDHQQGETVSQLAQRIKAGVVKIYDEMGLSADHRLERDWALAYGVCTWVSTRVIDAKDIPENNGQERIRRGQSQVVLDQNPPSAVCSGRSRLTRDLARECGLQAAHLGGDFRPLGGTAPDRSNHGWVCFIFGKNIVPADTTAADVNIASARLSYTRLPADLIMPRDEVAQELFNAERFSYQVLNGLGSYRNSNDYNASEVSYADWRRANTAYLINLRKQYRQLSY